MQRKVPKAFWLIPHYVTKQVVSVAEVTSKGGVSGIFTVSHPRGGTLFRGSEILSTAPVGNYEITENPAVQDCSSQELGRSSPLRQEAVIDS